MSPHRDIWQSKKKSPIFVQASDFLRVLRASSARDETCHGTSLLGAAIAIAIRREKIRSQILENTRLRERKIAQCKFFEKII